MLKKLEFDESEIPFNPTDDQLELYWTLMSGINKYVCGDAGTGKSKILEKYIHDARKQGKRVVVTGTTGRAADVLGGTTVHRAFGYPAEVLNAYKDDQIIKYDIKYKGKTNKYEYKVKSHFWNLSNAMLYADIIVIDEISMCRIDLFTLICKQIEYVNERRKKGELNKTNEIQLIPCGDFCQMKPISRIDEAKGIDEAKALKCLYKTFNKGYAYESKMWEKMNLEPPFRLNTVVRQKDEKFSEILKAIRVGDPLAWDVLLKLNDIITNKWDGETTVICGTRAEVREINTACLNKIYGPTYTFEERVTYFSDANVLESDRRNDKEVSFKVGARCMSLINDKYDNYQNGSVGVITKITNNSVFVKFDDSGEYEFSYFKWDIKDGTGKVLFSIEQIPIALAYALTVHKVQGMTFKKICLKPQIYFDEFMHYTALSRCESLEGIQFYDDNKFSRYCTYKSGYQKVITLSVLAAVEWCKKHGTL